MDEIELGWGWKLNRKVKTHVRDIGRSSEVNFPRLRGYRSAATAMEAIQGLRPVPTAFFCQTTREPNHLSITRYSSPRFLARVLWRER